MLLPDERSVWDDYLDLATPPNTPIAGQVCISAKIGYTVEQLAITIKTDPTVIEKANKRMMELGMITVANDGIIVVNNWSRYQSEYERQKGYRKGLQEEVTHKDNKRRCGVDKDKDKDIKDIYIYWNNKKIMVHKVVDTHRTAIRAALSKGFSTDEIKEAITNYSTILRSDRYIWTYKWTLSEFLKRGLERFMDGEIAKANFLKNEYRDESDDMRLLRKQIEDPLFKGGER